MPQDPVTGAWTPEEVIKSRFGLAQQFRNTPDASTPLGALAKGLGGLFGGVYQGDAENSVRANQGYQSQAIRDAMTQPDMKGQATKLIGSGVPALEMQGAKMMETIGLKRAEQQEKWDMISRMLGRPISPGQPVAGQQMQSTPSGVPGAVTGTAPDGLTPAPTAGKPPSIDKYTLGVMVAAGMIPKEAAALLQDDKKYEDAFDAQAGKDYAEEYKNLREGARKLQSQVATYDIMESLIKNPATLQGWGSNASLQLRRIADSFGIKTDGLQPTQVMQALAGELALQLRNPAGGAGMPGAMSDADRQFLTNMTAGIGNSPEANMFLIQMRKRMAEREIQVARLANNYAANNGGRLDHKFSAALQQWSDRNPLFNSKEKEALAGQHATVATEAPPQAATPAISPKAVAEAPVGTVLNGHRKVGPNQWVPADAPQEAAQPPAAPRQQETPAQRSARNRAQAQAELEAAPAQRAQAQAKAAQVQADFNADAQTLPPLALAQKYDALRMQLSEPQRIALNEAIAKATGR